MIDWSTVKSLVIPEGKVKKVMRGFDTIWEATAASVSIVVLPATVCTSSISNGVTYINEPITLTRDMNVGENYIVYINGTAHSGTSSLLNDSIVLSTNDSMVEFMPLDTGASINQFFLRILEELTSPITVEIHYIP